MPEEYLSFAYGNWKQPLRTSNKNLYNSNEFKDKKISLLRDIKNKIKKKFYLIWKGVKI